MKRLFPTIATMVSIVLGSCSSTPDYDASGIFEATETTLSSVSAGKILEIYADEGDTLQAGQCVALIDTTQLKLQWQQLSHMLGASRTISPDISLQVASLRSQLATQQSEKRRIERLLADGAATTKQLDDINASINVLTDNINSMLSSLGKTASQINENSMAIASQMAQIEASLADCRIITPVDGTLTRRYAEIGEFATPGRPIIKIADLDNMYLRAYFTSVQLADLTLGQPVTVIADYGGDTLTEYEGSIISIASESEFTPKNIQTDDSRANLVYAVKIAVKNTDGRLKIGGYGRVRL